MENVYVLSLINYWTKEGKSLKSEEVNNRSIMIGVNFEAMGQLIIKINMLLKHISSTVISLHKW